MLNHVPWTIVVIAAYGLLFMAVAVGLHLTKVKRRGGRTPVDFKLLRGPGETLRRRIAKFDEDFMGDLAWAAAIPLISGSAVIGLLILLRPQTNLWLGLGVAAIAFGIALVPAMRRILRSFERNRNDRLGYLGEREVAEQLAPLLACGWRVFHDVPAHGKSDDFNLDHVAIGPGGVALIETKTRRKGRARPGMKDHVVVFEGDRLVWPWGADRSGLDQAASQARWLGDFIRQRTGISTAVKPMLALPGWWVESRSEGPVSVLNAKNTTRELLSIRTEILSSEQIDLIARQIDPLCRDVTD